MSGLVDWPAAERNKQPILDILERVLPKQGLVLEIASATGQHVAHFAKALPDLTWQPSDYSEEHLQNLRARRLYVGLPNILSPILLDVTRIPWPVERADAIFNANMIHISPWATTLGLFTGAEQVLPPGAPLVTYGPYKVHGEHVSESNVEFDASMRERDPSFGVRDVDDITTVAEARGFALEEQIVMPANNFTLIFRRR